MRGGTRTTQECCLIEAFDDTTLKHVWRCKLSQWYKCILCSKKTLTNTFTMTFEHWNSCGNQIIHILDDDLSNDHQGHFQHQRGLLSQKDSEDTKYFCEHLYDVGWFLVYSIYVMYVTSSFDLRQYLCFNNKCSKLNVIPSWRLCYAQYLNQVESTLWAFLHIMCLVLIIAPWRDLRCFTWQFLNIVVTATYLSCTYSP